MKSREGPSTRVAVLGMGYVGLTLTAALARSGHEVHGVDVAPGVLDSLSRGEPHIFEPGIDEVFSECLGRNIFIGAEPPGTVDVAVICVSTPVDPLTHAPCLDNVRSAARLIAAHCRPETLVVVRSTVPVGTSREVVLPILERAWGSVRLVMAPERTIQGQALRELVELPQVVGGLDQQSLDLGTALFGGFTHQVVPVSSLEAAELVKLTNNCHTDVIYAFGNEVAMVTERLGLDPLEIIGATNLDYPRPDIARPGYVGGGCLSKDPYIMLSTGKRSGHVPQLIGAARALNEALPAHVARHVVEMMRTFGGTTVAVLGWAYKGRPATDDMRGTPIATMMPVFESAGLTVLGHDPLVADEVIRAYGGRPVDLVSGCREADAVLLVTDHPCYQGLDVDEAFTDSKVRVVYDSWRVLDQNRITRLGIRYAGIGFDPVTPAAGASAVAS